ncbi:retinoschisin-like [Acanthaster planci]|uniref:Retinoschisin-like n=1 Tax=Acanthaster planci TaxID=133434 RepID=A0A8B8A0T9_ACAPL|nr:retinoschisin-like [Acanthaster planci]
MHSCGVESTARTCYFGPPLKPDLDNPDYWMKLVMKEIQEHCPGKRGCSSAEEGLTEPAPNIVECSAPKPLGLSDGTIADSQISASSSQPTFNAQEARLFVGDGWASESIDTNPWIEVDLGESTVVSGVVTEAYLYLTGICQLVTKYRVAYQTQSSSDRVLVTDGKGNATLFKGNTECGNPVMNLFNGSVVARVVRVEPVEWRTKVALKLELLGCRHE